MTREEAIEQIKWYFECDDGIAAEDITKQAIDMAIEALSNQVTSKLESVEIPTVADEESTMSQPNSKLDLISRADVIKAVQAYLNILINSRRHGDDFTFINVLTEIRNKISALPSADRPIRLYEEGAIELLRMTGWLTEHDKEIGRPHGEWIDVDNEPYCECSVCGSYIYNLDDDYAFCPRCGARMENK